jgi:hypothetical protein
MSLLISLSLFKGKSELWHCVALYSQADVDELAPLIGTGNTKSHSDMESSDWLELQESGMRGFMDTVGWLQQQGLFTELTIPM